MHVHIDTRYFGSQLNKKPNLEAFNTAVLWRAKGIVLMLSRRLVLLKNKFWCQYNEYAQKQALAHKQMVAASPLTIKFQVLEDKEIQWREGYIGSSWKGIRYDQKQSISVWNAEDWAKRMMNSGNLVEAYPFGSNDKRQRCSGSY